MYITIKSLMSAATEFKCRLDEPFINMHLRYAHESGTPYDAMKFIYEGKSMLTFANAFASLRELGISNGDTIHMVLRLGGPHPQEQAVFEYLKLKQVHHGNMPLVEEFTEFFEQKNIGDAYAVRVIHLPLTTCCREWHTPCVKNVTVTWTKSRGCIAKK